MSPRWVAVLAVVVLVLAGLLGWGVFASQRATDVATPTNATEDGTGLVVGEGAVTVDVWLDFHCPHCREFERQAGATLERLAADGEVRLVYHPVAFLTDASRNDYSARASASAGCAADAGALPEYLSALLAAQPGPGEDGLTDDELVSIGASVWITQPDFATCVRERWYEDWTTRVTEAAGRAGVHGVPTVEVGGERVPASVPAITAAVRGAGTEAG